MSESTLMPLQWEIKHENIQLLFIPSLLAATGKKDGTSKTVLAGKEDVSMSSVSEGTWNGRTGFKRGEMSSQVGSYYSCISVLSALPHVMFMSYELHLMNFLLYPKPMVVLCWQAFEQKFHLNYFDVETCWPNPSRSSRIPVDLGPGYQGCKYQGE